ncbi:MAG: CotH kinase family protein [Fibrobacter sp.]|nr:CotH kinase family protein [Fibrobacter sp.]
MISLKKIANIAALCCLGFCITGLVGCLEEDPVSQTGGNNNSGSDPSNPPVDPNTGKPMQSYQDTVTYRDSITGQIITKIDTFFLPEDTTLRWVGNSSLRITEIAPVNLDWLDEELKDPGWVEIYNAGSDTANLKNYTLVENRENARKWFFGNVKIAPKGFLTVFCDKKNVQEASADVKDTNGVILGHGRPHTNWKLEKDGGILYLIDPYYGIRDSVVYPELTTGLSWGIVDGGVWKYFEKPTPEQPNTKSTAYDGVAPEFSFAGAAGGFYNDEVTLKAPNAPDGMKIRCTRNGSAPTKDSPEFNQTITISQNTVLRCAAFKEGLLTNKVVTNTYFIGELVKMPVVAVSVDSNFFRNHYVPKKECGSDDPKSCPAGLMADVEFPVHVEYFAEGSNSKSKAWEMDAGISLMGGWSRVADKKSVAVVMREEYEAGWLKYPLFETRKDTHSKFKGFNLRNNGNRFVSDYIEDAVGGAALEGSGVDYQRSRQVVVFYNGKYWGIHDMRERFNKNYVETNYDIDAGTVEIIKILGKSDSSLTGNTQSAVNNFRALLDFIGSADFSGENNQAYEMVKSLMDVGNYADYMAAEIYYKNGDWPNNNVRAWRAPDHPWKFMIYDLDHGFGWKWGVNGGEFDASSTNMFSWIKKGGGNKPCKETGCFANIYIQLIKNPDFKRLFLNHAAVLYQNYVNGFNIGKVVDKMVASMSADEMERDLEKFKQKEKYYPDGFSTDGKILVEWAEKRDGKIFSEYEEEFGLSGTVKVSIAASGKGSVEVDGMKLPSSSYSGKFFAGVGMTLEAKEVDGGMFIGWSDGVTEKVRYVEPTDGATYTANFK